MNGHGNLCKFPAVRASLARTRYSRQAKHKTKTMKRLQLLALGSALVGVSQVTQGSVLLGFNSFTEDAIVESTDVVPDEAQAGWSGSVSSTGFTELGGSSDSYYGVDNDLAGQGHLIYSTGPGADNGYVDVANGTKFSGMAGTSGTIDALLFDAASVSVNKSIFNVSWNFWTDVSKTTVASTGSTAVAPLEVGPGNSINVNSNYKDFAVNLGSFFLPAGGVFEIVWNRVGTTPGNFKLDNIALVPEPGSMLGLGCLVGFGTLLRSRRRTGPAVIA